MIGAWCWLLTILYFVVQLVVAAAWPFPYSLSENTISDLGVTECGLSPRLDGGAKFACSPQHTRMNAAIVVVGVLTAAGAAFTRRVWLRRRLAAVAVAFVTLAGLGGVLVGLAPANVALPIHAVGALLQVPGAVAPLLLGLVLYPVDRLLAGLGVVCGVTGSVASALYFAGLHLGLGPGIVERLAVEPLTVWTVLVGLVLLAREHRRG